MHINARAAAEKRSDVVTPQGRGRTLIAIPLSSNSAARSCLPGVHPQGPPRSPRRTAAPRPTKPTAASFIPNGKPELPAAPSSVRESARGLLFPF